MIIIKDLKKFASIPQTDLTNYLEKKFSSMVVEYNCSMAEIGEVHIYESDSEFLVNDFATYELIEVIQVSNFDYLHLVELVGDYYAKDIYVPIQRKEVN